MVWITRIFFVLAVAFLGLTFVNASWIVGQRPGRVRLIANGGIAQFYTPGARGAPCPARAIQPPIHTLLEDTVRAITTAHTMGADRVAIDLVRTADGALVLYPDTDLGCRTEASGPVSAKTLAQLRRLDVGYGYTADAGVTFPLRGKGRGLITTLDDLLDAIPRVMLVYRFPGNDPAAFDLAASILKAHGHNPVALGEGFLGDAALAAAAGKAFPGVWTVAADRSAACIGAYRMTGWTGIVPGVCRGAGLRVPLDRTLTLWGWPARFETRIEDAGGMILLVGDSAGDGLRHSRQLGDVPSTFHGFVMVDNYWTVGPAFRPSLDGRTNAEGDAAQKRDDNDP